MITSVLDAASNDVALVPEPGDGQAEFVPQLWGGGTHQVPEFHPLKVSPDTLVRVDLGSIPGQGLDLDAASPLLSQEVPNRFAPMDGGTIPDHQEFIAEMHQQVLQEADDIGTAIGVILDHHQQGLIHGDAADGRQVVSGEWGSQNRGLALGSVGPHDRGQGIEAALVYPDDSSTFFLGPLFTSGHRSVYHCLMASSSRWVARRVGFWTLQPISFRSRLT